MKDRALTAFVWFCLVGLLAGVVAVVTAVVLLVVRAADEGSVGPVAAVDEVEMSDETTDAVADGSASAAADGTAPPDAASPPATSDAGQGARACPDPPKAGPLERLAPLDVGDARPVDALDAYPQAKAMALELEPDAVLRYINADRVVRGRVDLSTDRIAYVFEYQKFGPSGRETGLVEVTASCWGMYGKLRRNAAIYRHDQYDPVPDPRCSTTQAWEAAVRVGLPEALPVGMIYRDDDIMVRGSPVVWSLTVDGKPEHRRDVHGHTCRPLRSFASGKPVLLPAERGPRGSNVEGGTATGTAN